jgi:hypothetical protein
MPSAPSDDAEAFYRWSLKKLCASDIPFLVGGTYAFAAHTGISRPTKDLDIFCKAGDFPRLLQYFQTKGLEIDVKDERWIGKVYKGAHFFDIIFGSANGTMLVTDTWFAHASEVELLGIRVPVLAPTELISSKVFIQLRHRFDGPDIMHVILTQHADIDWRRLLVQMGSNWEVLLAHLINFRWIYPTERQCIPRWLMDELIDRLQRQIDLPAPRVRICRGTMLSHVDYQMDVRRWGFAGLDTEETPTDE